MKLHSKQVYFLDGREFASLKQACTHLENEIGAILDKLPVRLAPKDALAVHSAIIANKDRLCALLSVVVESDDWDGESRNLLDMDL